jgi:hypothetical protein
MAPQDPVMACTGKTLQDVTFSTCVSEDSDFLGCDTVLLGENFPMFRRSSGSRGLLENERYYYPSKQQKLLTQ